MFADRKKTGLTWEEHQLFEQKLRNFDCLLKYPASSARILDLQKSIWDTSIIDLKYEMDEFLYLDCPEKGRLERAAVYYEGSFDPSIPMDYDIALSTFADLKTRLTTHNPKCKAIHILDEITDSVQKYRKSFPNPTFEELCQEFCR